MSFKSCSYLLDLSKVSVVGVELTVLQWRPLLLLLKDLLVAMISSGLQCSVGIDFAVVIHQVWGEKEENKWCEKKEKKTLVVNFINILWAAFTFSDTKSTKRLSSHAAFFALSGSASVKAARRTLVKLTLGRFITNIKHYGRIRKMRIPSMRLENERNSNERNKDREIN